MMSSDGLQPNRSLGGNAKTKMMDFVPPCKTTLALPIGITVSRAAR
jgi:hypothetical protein